ncbi:MAG: 2Fe-2S iron-sulfur cluster-binding protein [Terriglobales bacterium]
MVAPSILFRPFTRLIQIAIRGKQFAVPENNALLRCLQYLAPDEVSYGRFCWNEDCQYCRVTFDLGEGTPERAVLACKLTVQEGMRVREMTTEISYCMRNLELPEKALGRRDL